MKTKSKEVVSEGKKNKPLYGKKMKDKQKPENRDDAMKLMKEARKGLKGKNGKGLFGQ